ncbi:hypothetical protein HDU93_001631 [Gonapodya sp. JEL0774]|nr:hypothetical protein HDU93_001631 [Gonapodya sp. JEL0774]
MRGWSIFVLAALSAAAVKSVPLNDLEIVVASLDPALTIHKPCAPKQVKAYLDEVNDILSEAERVASEAAWAYETDVTDENLAKLADADVAFSSLALKTSRRTAKLFGKCDLTGPKFPASLGRQVKFLIELSTDTPSSKSDQKRLAQVIGEMTSTYAKARVDGHLLDPDLTATLATSRNADELERVYVGWRDANKVSKAPFSEYVELQNKAAAENGYKDMGAVWRSGYEMPTAEFDELLLTALSQISPLYDALHCYTYHKLRSFYGPSVVDGDDGLIPAHLLGNMWSQDWSNIYDILTPYPDVVSPTITPELIRQNYTAVKVHQLAESFYVSLGFDPLPETFWKRSMLVRPEGREVVCHASAWDFGEDDLRIKMCTTVTQEDVATVHHEQGPYTFRGGANDGFHEAIGDTVVLSFQTPGHLRDDLGMLPPEDGGGKEYEALINYQLHVALERIAVLPWTFLMDKWRWEVFEGLPSDQWNTRWWQLITKHQGLKAPKSLDTEAPDAFDPAAKYHISANVPYIRYFLAAIYQFQFHRALCYAAHPSATPALHECSIYGSKAAGQLFGEMLAMGRSEPWQKAMSVITQGREDTLNGTAVVDYFAPLVEWLRKQNEGKSCAWKSGFQQHESNMESMTKFGNWSVGADVGKGSFAAVAECSHDSGLRGVVKTTPRSQIKENPRLPLFVTRELATQLHTDSHPNIPKIYDYVESDFGYHLVMEKCEGEELFEYLKKQPGSRLPEDKVRIIMQQLLSALDFMHRRCVLHRDIKLDNLMIDPVTFHLMVIDFNLSTFFLPTSVLTEAVGCVHYASPPLLLAADSHPYRPERGGPDVWAAGVVCYGLLAGYFPFRQTVPRKLHREILTTAPGKLEWPAQGGAGGVTVTRAARDFVCKMLDPLTPVTAGEMLRHPFLAGKDMPEEEDVRAARSVSPISSSTSSPVIVEEVRYVPTRSARSRPSTWQYDATDVTASMVGLEDWHRVERSCQRYADKVLQKRRVEVQTDARLQEKCRVGAGQAGAGGNAGSNSHHISFGVAKCDGVVMWDGTACGTGADATARATSPTTPAPAPEPTSPRLGKFSFGRSSTTSSAASHTRTLFRRLPRPFSLGGASDKSDTTDADREAEAEARAADFADSLSDVETLAHHDTVHSVDGRGTRPRLVMSIFGSGSGWGSGSVNGSVNGSMSGSVSGAGSGAASGSSSSRQGDSTRASTVSGSGVAGSVTDSLRRTNSYDQTREGGTSEGKMRRTRTLLSMFGRAMGKK